MKKDYFIWNIEKFTTLITDLATNDIISTVNSNIPDPLYLKNIRKRLKWEALEGRIYTKSQRKKKSYFITNTIFFPFTEICSSLDSLINIWLYLKFPVPSEFSGDISNWVWIRYHIENHLHEIYILKCRLSWYIWSLKDSYNRHPDWVKIRFELDKIKVFLESKFKWIIDTRDEHVHEERFSDSKLDQISYFELLAKSKDKNFANLIEISLESVHLEWKKKWEEIMNNNIDVVIDIVDEYFWWLLKILQDSHDKKEIIYPEDIK